MVTATCQRKLDKHVPIGRVDRLRAEIEAAGDGDPLWRREWISRPPFWINITAPYALIGVMRPIDGYQVLCLIDVMEKDSSEYVALARNPRDARLAWPDDEELAAQLATRADEAPTGLDPLPGEWAPWLTPPGWEMDAGASVAIYESAHWVQSFRRQEIRDYWQDYYNLLFRVISDDITITPSQVPPAEVVLNDEVGLLFRRFRPEGERRRDAVFLIAPLRADAGNLAQSDAAIGNASLLSLPEEADFADIARHAERAYPDYLLGHREAWLAIQDGSEANLALSPEEEAILAALSRPRETSNLPVFLNGRAGSGKSTLLYYLFADYCDRKLESEELPGLPLFVTYNERLVETAQRSVANLLKYHHRFLAQRGLRDAGPQRSIDGFFRPFRELLLSLIGEPEQDRYRPEGHLSFHRFSQLYLGRPLLNAPTAEASNRLPREERELALNPDRVIKWSPELCWYVLRTFIKGYLPSGYMTPEQYAQVPRRERVVTDETFAAIHDTVWRQWYAGLAGHGLWDDQDLVRQALLAESVQQTSDFSAIFCDEAQDFTRLELRLIMQLSRLTKFDLQYHRPVNLPFGFAGDPFQTLNPTGFRWSACQAAFHDVVIDAVDPQRRYALSLHPKELLFNYRSTPPIVRLTNLIQLWRHVLFAHDDLKPQEWWGQGGFPEPEKFILERNLTPEAIDHVANTIVIVPCEEGQEHAFVRQDPELSAAFKLTDADEVPKNVLSAVAAKGLEFKRVVLYKFGEACPDLSWDTVGVSDQETLSEDTLTAEYFLNKLYVGATRAKEGLYVIDTVSGDARLWCHANSAAVARVVGLADTPTDWQPYVSCLAEGGDPAVMSERDPATIAVEFYDKGTTLKNPEHLRRASGFFTSAGQRGEARRCEALARRFEGDLRGAGQVFEELAREGDAWRAYWDGRCWPELASWYERSPAAANLPATEVEMVGHVAHFMTSDETATAPVRKFAAQLWEWGGENIGGPFNQQWREVVRTLQTRALALSPHALDDSGWLAIAQVLEGASDRGHHSRSAAAWAYRHAGEAGDAARCWRHAGDDNHPEFFRTQAELADSLAEKLGWLGRLPRDEQTKPILEAWEEGKDSNPRLGRVVADVVAPALERAAAEVAARDAATTADEHARAEEVIALYHDAFELYVTTPDGPRYRPAIACRAAAQTHMRQGRLGAEFWRWSTPLLERLADREMWDDLFTLPDLGEMARHRSDRPESLDLWASITKKLAYTHGTLFTDVFPDPTLLDRLPQDRTRYRALIQRLLTERGGLHLAGAPSSPTQYNADEMLAALKRRDWKTKLTFAEMASAHERRASYAETLKFYEGHIDGRSENREYARNRWLITKARQIAHATEDFRITSLRAEIDRRCSAWQNESTFG